MVVVLEVSPSVLSVVVVVLLSVVSFGWHAVIPQATTSVANRAVMIFLDILKLR